MLLGNCKSNYIFAIQRLIALFCDAQSRDARSVWAGESRTSAEVKINKKFKKKSAEKNHWEWKTFRRVH